MVWFVRCIVMIGLGAIGLSSAEAFADEVKPWYERMSVQGDFRYRHESIFKESAKDRNRHRIRARVGLKATINPLTDATLRLASGRGEPTSTNQDLGATSGQKPVWIDRAYLEFRPCKRGTLLGGKFGAPFKASDLMFDPDLNLEGVAGKFGSKDMNFYGSLGGYWLSESNRSYDQGLFSAQAGYLKSGESATINLALGYFDYQNLKHEPVLGTVGGNTVSAGTNSPLYVYDYNVAMIRAEWERKVDTKALTIWGEFAHNLSEIDRESGDPERNNAYVIGINCNAPKAKLPWDAGYNVRVLERDAAVAEFTDSDFIGGGTNGWGHRLTIGIVPAQNMTLRSTYFLNYIDPFDDGANLTYQRLMLDAEVKF